MPIHNRNMSNREPRQSLKGVYHSYTERSCPACGHTIISPEGQEWACVFCEQHPVTAAEPAADEAAQQKQEAAETAAWLQARMNEHLDWLDEKRTQEDARY